MDRYALLGKNISHSKSPEIYKRLLQSIEYDLLDISNEADIPSVEQLFVRYKGINITSPYKKHFVNEVKLTPVAQKLMAINCLARKGKDVWGENTDYPAVRDILKRFYQIYPNLNVAILGDGVMSKVTCLALTELNIPYELFSRKTVKCFDQLNFSDVKAGTKALIINTCSRDYTFKGELNSQSIFWDFNYNFDNHTKIIPSKVSLYMDGTELLLLQANYAVAFWSDF